MRLALACLLPLVFACSSTKVYIDYDEEFDFTGLTTYSWKPGIPAQNELNERRIVDGVDDALSTHGFQRIDEGQPDLFVATEVSTRQEVRSSGGSAYVGASHRTSWGAVGMYSAPTVDIREVTVGTLVIAVIDASTEELVWRASGTDTVNSDPERTAERIQDVIEKAFHVFPPVK